MPVTQDLGSHRMHRRLRISVVEFCDDHHTLPPLFFVVSASMLGPLLCALLPSHLHESLKGPAGGPTGTGATKGCRLIGPRDGVNAWRPSSQAIRVVPMAAISSSIAQTENRSPRARDGRAPGSNFAIGHLRLTNSIVRYFPAAIERGHTETFSIDKTNSITLACVVTKAARPRRGKRGNR